MLELVKVAHCSACTSLLSAAHARTWGGALESHRRSPYCPARRRPKLYLSSFYFFLLAFLLSPPRSSPPHPHPLTPTHPNTHPHPPPTPTPSLTPGPACSLCHALHSTDGATVEGLLESSGWCPCRRGVLLTLACSHWRFHSPCPRPLPDCALPPPPLPPALTSGVARTHVGLFSIRHTRARDR
jgi:hypothetical protein